MIQQDNFVKIETPYGNVYIDTQSDVAAIKLSGGWDSAVMCYLIACAVEQFYLNTIIQPLTVKRNNLLTHNDITEWERYDRVNNHTVARQVIDFVQRSFPNQKFYCLKQFQTLK